MNKSVVRRRSIAHRYSTRSIIDLTSSNGTINVATGRSGVSSAGTLTVDLYKELKELEDQDGVIRNTDFLYCALCETFVDSYDGIFIRNCLHQICINCARKLIIGSPQINVACPMAGCEDSFQDREIRSLLTQQEYEGHMYKEAFVNNKVELYKELLDLEQQGFIHSTEKFQCVICYSDIEAHDGVVMRECLHQFCIDCIRHTINLCEEAEVKCPAIDCIGFVHDREIRSLLTQAEFDKYNSKTLRIAECKASNSYHCKKANCEGWCIVDDEVTIFFCPLCNSENCLACQAIHAGRNCKQYQVELRYAGMSDDEKSEEQLDKIVRDNNGMRCTTCKIVIMKREGCDFLVCSMCKTELCWATKQSRWGPKGKGDTSGGCGCLPNKKCHPKCRNCH
ncbi:hypothetical protein HA402_015366 [Bradysia odoriphaga]|nr:hypothetical protein HA402_015366 [Bradysia odoriphaga]